MKFIDKLIEKRKEKKIFEMTIGFLGDSVTQGCFDCYIDRNGNIETYFDSKNAYSTKLREKLNIVYPEVNFNIINAGISGDKAERGYKRIDDVLKHDPDLVIVAYGLNDASQGETYLETYKNALKNIFKVLKEKDIDTIFLTPNMMAEYVRSILKDDKLIECGKHIVDVQNSGLLDKFIDNAREIAKDENIQVVDIYKSWKTLNSSGVDTTLLLANSLNHPIKEMQEFTASKLFEAILNI